MAHAKRLLIGTLLVVLVTSAVWNSLTGRREKFATDKTMVQPEDTESCKAHEETTPSMTNNIRFSSKWDGKWTDNKRCGAEICNDTTGFRTLMIVGNQSAGGPRTVSVWDKLKVMGELCIGDTCLKESDLIRIVRR
jgi:hypothetical protein